MTTTTESILLVGRGESAYGFDWQSVACPIMAVSSGIYAIPRSIPTDHFVSLDEPKNYMAQLMAHAPHAWQHDQSCQYWPFWSDPSIVKHVVAKRIRTVVNMPLPIGEIIGAIEDFGKVESNKPWMRRKRITVNRIKDAFYTQLGEQYTQFGLQPGWGDYQNVKGWNVKALRYPRWSGDGPLAVWKPPGRNEPLYNSLLMAVQIATRLGYRELNFIGVDLTMPEYAGLVRVMREWHAHAKRAGYRWNTLTSQSALSDFMPVRQQLEIAA